MKPNLSFTTLACPEWDVARIVGAAVANGYDAIDFRGYLGDVELPASPAFRGDALHETAARVRDAGLAVSCLGSGAKMSAPDAAARGEAPETSARNLSPFVRNTHWKDSRPLPDGKRRFCLPGLGAVPLAAIRNALAAVGYDGWFTLEWEKRWHPEIEEPGIAIASFAGFMRGLAADWPAPPLQETLP